MPERENEGYMLYVFRKFYAPTLLSTYARITVVKRIIPRHIHSTHSLQLIGFIAWLCTSIAVLNKIELGLDSRLSVPEDSYVLQHFNSMHNYLSVGPPTYFVVGCCYEKWM